MAVASAGSYASLHLSLQKDNHATTPPLSFFTGRMPFLPPNQQHQSTEGIIIIIIARQLYPVQVISQVNAEKRPAWNVIADETVGQVFNVAGPLQVLL